MQTLKDLLPLFAIFTFIFLTLLIIGIVWYRYLRKGGTTKPGMIRVEFEDVVMDFDRAVSYFLTELESTDGIYPNKKQEKITNQLVQIQDDLSRLKYLMELQDEDESRKAFTTINPLF